jgi:hypothetical protein
MRLPSVADRLGERFVRPLAIDRLRALVRPAIDQSRTGPSTGAFARLEAEIAQFTREVLGAGFDVPSWLEALEQEVDRTESQSAAEADLPDPLLQLAQVRLSRDEARRLVEAMLRDE